MFEAGGIVAKEVLTFAVTAAAVRRLVGEHRHSFRLFMIAAGGALSVASCFLIAFPDRRFANVISHWNESAVVALLVAGTLLASSVNGANQREISENAVPHRWTVAVWLLLPFWYLFPDWAGSLLYLRDSIVLQNNFLDAGLGLAGGIFLSIAIGLPLFRLIRSSARGPGKDPWMAEPQFLYLLATMKLLGGGVKGYAEYSLVPSIQKILMKFTHDLIHHIFTVLLVPDHLLLRASAWDFIGYFFGPSFAFITALAILLLPPGIFLTRTLSATANPPADIRGRADRRLYIAGFRRDTYKRSATALVFVVMVLGTWFGHRNQDVERLYDPSPVPVVSDHGFVSIPRTGPTVDLGDGRIHKFLVREGDRDFRFLIIKRPDGRFAVCLDACEICPPDGYGQRGDHVICLYCNTPISTDTLGRPGGCNPIPVPAVVSHDRITISVQDVLDAWADVAKKKANGGSP